MTERLVIDTSVAVKWFIRDTLESNIDLADDLLTAFLEGKLELYAPPVFPFEVCNAFTKACGHRYPGTRLSRLTKQKAAEYMRQLFNLPITIEVLTQDQIIEVIGLAVDYSKTYC